MGVFGPVIEALVLPMLDLGHDLPLGSRVTLQLVSDKHTRGSILLLVELAKQAFGGLLIAPALDENIENEAVLVDGTQSQCFLPAKLMTTSSRCHLSPRRGARRRIRLAESRPFTRATQLLPNLLLANLTVPGFARRSA
jgi:hypothetical protein